MTSNLLTVSIHSDDVEELRELARTRSYDFGCKPFPIPTEDDGYILPALLTPSQYNDLTSSQSSKNVDIQFTGVPRDRAAKVTIGWRSENWALGPINPMILAGL